MSNMLEWTLSGCWGYTCFFVFSISSEGFHWILEGDITSCKEKIICFYLQLCTENLSVMYAIFAGKFNENYANPMGKIGFWREQNCSCYFFFFTANFQSNCLHKDFINSNFWPHDVFFWSGNVLSILALGIVTVNILVPIWESLQLQFQHYTLDLKYIIKCSPRVMFQSCNFISAQNPDKTLLLSDKTKIWHSKETAGFATKPLYFSSSWCVFH